MIGKTISHYRILEKLGGGGMGVVYKAQDLRLDRLVALKFLPPHLGSDDDEKQRFIHEAKAASSLDHTNICTIYEVDAAPDGQMFIVMAYYEGETLKKRIERGPLKIDEAIGIAAQIAQGLSKAHEHAIVHRDIKPANIMLTKDGVVKIVDFGLAKLRGQTVLTKTGTTMGTVMYMSPEQARGEPADHRSDIWALGAVLYEMLTGTPPFHSDYENAVVYSILNTMPEPLTSLRTGVPLELERIVSKALEKDPAERFQHIDEFAVDLRRLRKETTGVTVVGGQRPTGQVSPSTSVKAPVAVGISRKQKIAAGIALIAIACIAAVVYVFRGRSPEPNPNSITRILTTPFSIVSYPTMSSDGKWIAFGAADRNGKWDVYLMNTSGGEPRRVTFDSSIVVTGPDISEDGSTIAYCTWNPVSKTYGVALVPSLGGGSRIIVEQGILPHWMHQQHRLSYLPYCQAWNMPSKSGRFELWSVETDGSDARMEYTDSIGYDWRSFCYSWSPDGAAFVFVRTFRDGTKELVVHDCASGKERQMTSDGRLIDEVMWTHDNHIIYSSTRSGKTDLWMMSVNGGEPLQLTRGSGSVTQGRLSDDGKRLMYYELNLGGKIRIGNLKSGEVELVTNDQMQRGSVGISPDGRYIAYPANSTQDQLIPLNDIILLDRRDQRKWHLLSGKGTIYSLVWSPDGKRIAYETSSDSVAAKHEIYVTTAFEPGLPKLLGQGSDPIWFDATVVGWTRDNNTWSASTEDPHPKQYYQDSTRAFPVQGGKYVSFRKVGGYRWLDLTPNEQNPARKQLRLLLKESWFIRLANGGREFVALQRPGKLVKFLLPEVRKVEIPFEFPGLQATFSVSGNAEEVAYTEFVGDMKLVVVENPFK